MRTPRVYINQKLELNTIIELSKETAQHIITVLKRKTGHNIILFNNNVDTNNKYGEYTAEIIESKKNTIILKILEYNIKSTVSSVNIELAQGISKAQHFEVTLQKSVELGVNIITPIVCERSEQIIKNANLENKMARWHKIIIHASEQSGRTDLPILNEPITIDNWLNTIKNQNSFLLCMCTKTNNGLKNLINHNQANNSIKIIIGPEGGLSEQEINLCSSNNFNLIKLGRRIMRTETAGITILSILQYVYGDFA